MRLARDGADQLDGRKVKSDGVIFGTFYDVIHPFDLQIVRSGFQPLNEEMFDVIHLAHARRDGRAVLQERKVEIID